MGSDASHDTLLEKQEYAKNNVLNEQCRVEDSIQKTRIKDKTNLLDYCFSTNSH